MLALAGPAHAASRPDLLVTKLSSPAGNTQPESSHTATAAVRNLGTAPAGRSTAVFYLSADSRRSRGDVRLGGAAVASLRAGRGAGAPGAWAAGPPPRCARVGAGGRPSASRPPPAPPLVAISCSCARTTRTASGSRGRRTTAWPPGRR